MFKNMKSLNKMLLNCLNYFLIFSSISIVALIVIGSVLRYIFQIDFFGMEDIVMFFAISLYFIGSAVASYKNDHINADVVTSFTKPGKFQNVIITIRNLITVVATMSLLYWGFDLLSWAIETGVATQTIKVPLLFHFSVVFLSFILMTIYESARFVSHLRKGILKGDKK